MTDHPSPSHPVFDDPLFVQLTWSVTPELWDLASRFVEILPPEDWGQALDPEHDEAVLDFLRVLSERRSEARVARALEVITEVLDRFPIKSFFRLVLAYRDRGTTSPSAGWTARLGGTSASMTF
ncbi:MAG: hypothetical protein AAFU79_21905 [Myxococcota bacterium]